MASAVAEILIEVEPAVGDKRKTIKVPLETNETLKLGCDKDSNEVVLNAYNVSRNHLEIYSITIASDSRLKPLVYVRDRESAAGTFVNGEQIGGGSLNITKGRLVEHMDTIMIKPSVTITIHQPPVQPEQLALTSLQMKEVKMFRDEYIVTDRVLGKGGFARVHLAIDAKTNQQLACKVQDIKKMRNGWKQRLLQEVEIHSQLDHPNIISFKRAYRTKHTLYTIEELATGGDMLCLYRRLKSFDVLEIKWIMKQVLSGVKHMHQKGVAHRDIKLENTLCTISPKSDHRVAIADLGSSEVAGSERITTLAGSPGYQAPEQFGLGHGLAVDIWAVGVMCLEALVGCRGINDQGILMPTTPSGSPVASGYAGRNAGLEGLLDSLHTTKRKRISEKARDFLLGCLDWNPVRRLSVEQAMNHPWLSESEAEKVLLETRQREVVETWKPRAVMLPLIRKLDGVETLTPESSPVQRATQNGEDPETGDEKSPLVQVKKDKKRKAACSPDSFFVNEIPKRQRLETPTKRSISKSFGSIGRHKIVKTM